MYERGVHDLQFKGEIQKSKELTADWFKFKSSVVESLFYYIDIVESCVEFNFSLLSFVCKIFHQASLRILSLMNEYFVFVCV